MSYYGIEVVLLFVSQSTNTSGAINEILPLVSQTFLVSVLYYHRSLSSRCSCLIQVASWQNFHP